MTKRSAQGRADVTQHLPISTLFILPPVRSEASRILKLVKLCLMNVSAAVIPAIPAPMINTNGCLSFLTSILVDVTPLSFIDGKSDILLRQTSLSNHQLTKPNGQHIHIQEHTQSDSEQKLERSRRTPWEIMLPNAGREVALINACLLTSQEQPALALPHSASSRSGS